MESIDYIAEAITDALGERCEEYSEGCPTCEAWKQYDDLKGRAASPAGVGVEISPELVKIIEALPPSESGRPHLKVCIPAALTKEGEQ